MDVLYRSIARMLWQSSEQVVLHHKLENKIAPMLPERKDGVRRARKPRIRIDFLMLPNRGRPLSPECIAPYPSNIAARGSRECSFFQMQGSPREACGMGIVGDHDNGLAELLVQPGKQSEHIGG